MRFIRRSYGDIDIIAKYNVIDSLSFTIDDGIVISDISSVFVDIVNNYGEVVARFFGFIDENIATIRIPSVFYKKALNCRYRVCINTINHESKILFSGAVYRE